MMTEHVKTARDFSSEADRDSVAEIENRTAIERLRVCAEQANITLIMTLSVFIGFAFLFRNQFDSSVYLYTPVLMAPYLLFKCVTQSMLRVATDSLVVRRWMLTFTVSAALCGLLWGSAAGWLLLQGNSEIDLLLAPLMVSLAAAGMASFGILPSTYFAYIAGLLIPVGLTFSMKTSGFDFTHLVLVLGFSSLLILVVTQLRRRLDRWLNLAIENTDLVYQLTVKKQLCDEALVDLKDEFEERHLAENLLLMGQMSEQNQEFEESQSQFNFEINTYKKALKETEARQEMLEKLLSIVPGMAYQLARKGEMKIDYISDGSKQLLGLSGEQIRKQGMTRISDILVPSKRRLHSQSDEYVDDGVSFHREYFLLTPTGDERRVVECGARTYDQDGEIKTVSGYVYDVTDHYRLVDDIKLLSSSDELTGLLSRVQFDSIVDDILEGTDTVNDVHSLLCIDIDHFKAINDRYGMTFGDDVLREFGRWLRNHFKQIKSLARIGGDQFGVILSNCDLEQAALVATELCNALKQADLKLNINKLELTVSIGVASTISGLDCCQDLLNAAYRATNNAKENGRDRVNLYHRGDSLLLQGSHEMH